MAQDGGRTRRKSRADWVPPGPPIVTPLADAAYRINRFYADIARRALSASGTQDPGAGAFGYHSTSSSGYCGLVRGYA